MGWYKILIYSCTFFILTSCCTPVLQKKFYKTEYGSNRPKKNRFKLSKKIYTLKKEDQISTSYIYQSSFKMDLVNKKLKSDYTVFFRFFKNGRYITNVLKDKSIALNQYNNLKSGTIGYYKILGNKILLEDFSVGAHDCGKYHQYELNMIGDSIVGYEKIKIEGLAGTPSW
ncbi:hypothetical protein PG911_00330 [Tenacibaculum ovolyticum]|uniref:hypothetical protein n=2 Tax=Tenacibaculum ovolyticum TaxID=104270 RepID=UPI0022F38E30|nr:hypothetical protein [Tenacibaculum ovolyticum]WBX76739.1 hypothetical protein PG911_00330 [Tenacibaculum ovolyticum]